MKINIFYCGVLLLGICIMNIVNDFRTDYIYEGKVIQPILNLNELNVNIDVFTCFNFDEQFHDILMTRYGDYLTHILHYFTFKSVPFKNYDKDIEDCYKLFVIFVTKIFYYDALFEVNSDGIVSIETSNKINVKSRIMVERIFQIILNYIKLESSEKKHHQGILSLKKTLFIINTFFFERIDLLRNFICSIKESGLIHLEDQIKWMRGKTNLLDDDLLKNNEDLKKKLIFDYNPETLSEKVAHFIIVIHNLRKEKLLTDVSEFDVDTINVIRTIMYSDFKYKKSLYKPLHDSNRSFPELSYKMIIRPSSVIDLESKTLINISESFKSGLFKYDSELTEIVFLIKKFSKNPKELPADVFEEILQYFGNIYSINNQCIDTAKKIIIASSIILMLERKNNQKNENLYNLVDMTIFYREIEIRVDLFYDRVKNFLCLKYIVGLYDILNDEFNELNASPKNKNIYDIFPEFYINTLFLNTLGSKLLEKNEGMILIANEHELFLANVFFIYEKLLYGNKNKGKFLEGINWARIDIKFLRLKLECKNFLSIDIETLKKFTDSCSMEVFLQQIIDTKYILNSNTKEFAFEEPSIDYKTISNKTYLEKLKNVKILRKVKIPFICDYDTYLNTELVERKYDMDIDFKKMKYEYLSTHKNSFFYEGIIEAIFKKYQSKMNTDCNDNPDIQKKETDNINDEYEADDNRSITNNVKDVKSIKNPNINKNFTNNEKMFVGSENNTQKSEQDLESSSSSFYCDNINTKKGEFPDEIFTIESFPEEGNVRMFFYKILIYQEKEGLNQKSYVSLTDSSDTEESIIFTEKEEKICLITKNLNKIGFKNVPEFMSVFLPGMFAIFLGYCASTFLV